MSLTNQKNRSRLIKVPIKDKTPEETAAIEAIREKNIEFHLAFIAQSIKINEEKMLDVPEGLTTNSTLTETHREIERLSKIWFWLSEVKKARFLVPREQAKQKLAVKPEDAARLGLPTEPGKLIEMPVQ